MPDWLFHWTHDDVFKEVLKALIPAIGYVFVGAITWIGIWRTSKIAKQTLEDAREATPPELLRLEKWSTILKDSEQYPKNFDMGINTIYRTYKDVLKRATLENRIKNMAIWDSEVEDKLLKIKPQSGISLYPMEDWKVQNIHELFTIVRIKLYISLMTLSLLCCIFQYSIFFNKFLIYNTFITAFCLFVLSGSIGYVASIIILDFMDKPLYISRKRINSIKILKNIIYRNCYHALKDVFLVDGLEVYESLLQNMEREEFENTKFYKKWKKENPQLTSWNYGLSISWDNNPEKDSSIEYYI